MHRTLWEVHVGECEGCGALASVGIILSVSISFSAVGVLLTFELHNFAATRPYQR